MWPPHSGFWPHLLIDPGDGPDFAVISVKHSLFVISSEIFDQVSIARYFDIFGLVFESLNVFLAKQIAEFWFVSYYTDEHPY